MQANHYDRTERASCEASHYDRTEREGYELFRRAIVEGDVDAWAESIARYRRLLLSWARDASARMAVVESYEDLADHALARAWMALSPARFANFPSLGAVLAYLRACVSAAVVDCARAEGARERMLGRLEVSEAASPETLVLQDLDRAELWSLVGGLLNSEQERVVVVESFLFDLPPRTILAGHPELFASIDAVYAAKRNLLTRLKGNRALQEMFEELCVG
jgi:hypothetical protein